MRSLTIVLTVIATMFAAPPAQAAEQTTGQTTGQAASQELIGSPIQLKRSSVVDANLIVLGDIFENTGDLAMKPVAYAPQPGRQATYGANWLYQIAQHFGLDWQPMSLRDAIVIERDSRIITRQQIEDEVLRAIGDSGTDGNVAVSISNRTLQLNLPASSTGGIAVTDLNYDAASGRFVAEIEAPAGDPLAQRVRVSGSVIHVIDVPVPTHHIDRGEIISKSDLTWHKVDASKISRDTLVDLADLVGKAPRNGLRVGAPVRSSEVKAPELVAKSSLVTVIINQPAMRLTSRGKALDAGAKGEVIRVLNTRSNKIVQAVVSGPGEAVVDLATVSGSGLVAMN